MDNGEQSAIHIMIDNSMLVRVAIYAYAFNKSIIVGEMNENLLLEHEEYLKTTKECFVAVVVDHS